MQIRKYIGPLACKHAVSIKQGQTPYPKSIGYLQRLAQTPYPTGIGYLFRPLPVQGRGSVQRAYLICIGYLYRPYLYRVGGLYREPTSYAQGTYIDTLLYFHRGSVQVPYTLGIGVYIGTLCFGHRYRYLYRPYAFQVGGPSRGRQCITRASRALQKLSVELQYSNFSAASFGRV